MKKLFLIIACALSLTAVHAQTTKKTSVEVDYMEASSRYLEPTQAFLTIPVIADLQVSQTRISYTEKEAFRGYTVTDDLIKLVPNFKQIALCRAAKAHNADVVLGATIDVITNAEGFLEITITGYPASYSNFRNAKDTDIEIIRKGAALFSDKGSVIMGSPQSNVEIEEVNVKHSKKQN